MKEPHKKGLAIHLDPKSCAGGRKGAGEALTGAHTGQPWSSEITSTGVPTLWCEGEGHLPDDAIRKSSGNAAESQILSMCGNSLRENRETPAIPSTVGGEGRPEKASGPTSGTHVAGESDDPIVPTKRTNKAERSAAESVEKGDRPRGTLCGPYTCRTQGRENVASDCQAYDKRRSGIRSILIPTSG